MAALTAHLHLSVLEASDRAVTRVAALKPWRRQNPSLGAEEDILLGAAALASLIGPDVGPRFEPASSTELIDFIVEMPV